MTSTSLVSISAGVGVVLFYAVARRLVPFQPPADIPAEDLDKLQRKSRWTELAITVPCLLLAAVCGLGITSLLVGLARLRNYMMPDYLMLVSLSSSWIVWFLPGFFLGLICGGWLSMLSVKWLFGGEAYQNYLLGCNARYGFDVVRIWSFLSRFFVIAAAIWTVLALDWYVRFESDRMAVNNFLGIGETVYRYDQVTHIVETSHLTAPSGNVVTRTRQFVVFSDGQNWCQDGILQDAAPLLDLLTDKTGLEVIHAKFFEDVIPP